MKQSQTQTLLVSSCFYTTLYSILHQNFYSSWEFFTPAALVPLVPFSISETKMKFWSTSQRVWLNFITSAKRTGLLAICVFSNVSWWPKTSSWQGHLWTLIKYPKIPNNGRALYSRTKKNLPCALFIWCAPIIFQFIFFGVFGAPIIFQIIFLESYIKILLRIKGQCSEQLPLVTCHVISSSC